MLELEEALARILAEVPPPAPESIPLSESFERVLVQAVVSQIDLPPFDNSAMDGYAVRAADVVGAKPESAVGLRLVGRVAAGELFPKEIAPGTCVRLFTGSPLPRGADAVVMQEDVQIDASDSETVLVMEAAKPLENVRLSGEDVKAGTTIAEAGERITAGRLTLLAATGITPVQVGRQPVVGLVATGSELREAGEALAPGEIYETNRLGLAALIRGVGGIARLFPLTRDDLASTREVLEEAMEQCDLVVTSGGVSVGEMDFVKGAFEALGGEIKFWRVAIKPGRPFALGRRGKKLLFGLPGNPVSALVTFLLLVRPALLRWQGASETALPGSPGVLSETLANRGERRHFMRVKVGAGGRVDSAGTQASHMLSSLAAANGLVEVPAQTTLAKGTTVEVKRWD